MGQRELMGRLVWRGGGKGGNGGRLEIWGKGFLMWEGIGIGGKAGMGLNGHWLLDPRDVIIDTATTTSPPGYSANFTASQDSSHVNVADINGSLNGGTSVTISTGNTGTQNGDITVNAAISKSSGNNATL